MLKYFVSTEETQGDRLNDFCLVPEDELLRFGSECDNEEIDGSCGCRRSMVGMFCHKATTTIKISELSLTELDMVKKLINSLDDAGWKIKDEEDRKDCEEEVKKIISIANQFPVGTILERHGDIFQRRKE